MHPKKWKFISRKDILEHPRLHLVEDQVELPDGAKTSYLRESPATRHSVTVIALNEQEDVLLQQEYSYPPDEVLWQFPGGTVEREEDVIAAANRELSEESGFIANSTKLLGYYYTNNRRSNQKQYVMLCRDLVVHRKEEDPEEFITSTWTPLIELRRKIRAGEVHNMNLLAAMNLWLAS